MDAFIHVPREERRLVFEQAQAVLNLPARSVEKDFWVCWTLRQLFGLPRFATYLTFKGGTSLAKVWRLIERFSEDVDIIMERDCLGFGGERSPEAAKGKKQRQKRLKELKAACQERVQAVLRPDLEQQFREALPPRKPGG